MFTNLSVVSDGSERRVFSAGCKRWRDSMQAAVQHGGWRCRWRSVGVGESARCSPSEIVTMQLGGGSSCSTTRIVSHGLSMRVTVVALCVIMRWWSIKSGREWTDSSWCEQKNSLQPIQTRTTTPWHGASSCAQPPLHAVHDSAANAASPMINMCMCSLRSRARESWAVFQRFCLRSLTDAGALKVRKMNSWNYAFTIEIHES